MGDGLLLVVAVEMSWWCGEGCIGTAPQYNSSFVVGHLLDEWAYVLCERPAGHAFTDGHHHVDVECHPSEFRPGTPRPSKFAA